MMSSSQEQKMQMDVSPLEIAVKNMIDYEKLDKEVCSMSLEEYSESMEVLWSAQGMIDASDKNYEKMSKDIMIARMENTSINARTVQLEITDEEVKLLDVVPLNCVSQSISKSCRGNAKSLTAEACRLVLGDWKHIAKCMKYKIGIDKIIKEQTGVIIPFCNFESVKCDLGDVKDLPMFGIYKGVGFDGPRFFDIMTCILLITTICNTFSTNVAYLYFQKLGFRIAHTSKNLMKKNVYSYVRAPSAISLRMYILGMTAFLVNQPVQAHDFESTLDVVGGQYMHYFTIFSQIVTIVLLTLLGCGIVLIALSYIIKVLKFIRNKCVDVMLPIMTYSIKKQETTPFELTADGKIKGTWELTKTVDVYMDELGNTHNVIHAPQKTGTLESYQKGSEYSKCDWPMYLVFISIGSDLVGTGFRYKEWIVTASHVAKTCMDMRQVVVITSKKSSVNFIPKNYGNEFECLNEPHGFFNSAYVDAACVRLTPQEMSLLDLKTVKAPTRTTVGSKLTISTYGRRQSDGMVYRTDGVTTKTGTREWEHTASTQDGYSGTPVISVSMSDSTPIVYAIHTIGDKPNGASCFHFFSQWINMKSDKKYEKPKRESDYLFKYLSKMDRDDLLEIQRVNRFWYDNNHSEFIYVDEYGNITQIDPKDIDRDDILINLNLDFESDAALEAPPNIDRRGKIIAKPDDVRFEQAKPDIEKKKELTEAQREKKLKKKTAKKLEMKSLESKKPDMKIETKKEDESKKSSSQVLVEVVEKQVEKPVISKTDVKFLEEKFQDFLKGLKSQQAPL